MPGKKDPTFTAKRPLAMTAATAAVAISIGLPTAAHAAEPLRSDVFYATAASDEPRIWAVDPATGALTDPGLPARTGVDTAMNQVGVSRDGSLLVATDADNVYRYTAATGAWDFAPRSSGPSVPNTHGALDPQTGHLFYGGLSGGQIRLAEYDPVTNTIAESVIVIDAPGAPGGNGDLAFDGAGNLYIVLGEGVSRLYRVDRAALASGSGTAEQLGGDIAASSLNSIAFGADGYLYVAGGPSTSATSRFVKVDPGTGEIVSETELDRRITDLASTAVPRTATVGLETPGGLIDGDDEFEVVLENAGGTDLVAEGSDAAGNASGGPAAVVPDQDYTVSLNPGSTTNPDDYTTTWSCTDGTGAVIASGEGTSGSFTYPGAAEAIDCIFVNVPRPLPTAADDEDLRNTQGESVTIAVVGNDTGDVLDAGSVTIVNGDARVTELVVPGEGIWTVDPETGDITFTPETGFTGNPAPITYEVSDSRGHAAQAAVVITYLPIAADDSDLDNVPGSTVTVAVASNDTGEGLDPASVKIVDPASGAPVSELVIPGEGTWTVDPETGDITFTPEAGFINDPAPITYVITDAEGETVEAQVTVTYLPSATDDTSSGNQPGSAVTVPVVDNDSEAVDPTTVRVTDPTTGDPVEELVVPGEGTWTVDPETGDITFTPEAGFDGNPTPISYTAEDAEGNPVEAAVVVTYLPVAADDEDLDNVVGTPVTVAVTDNDSDNVDPSTVRITDPVSGAPVTELVVPGEGTWTVDPETGDITFTPENGFFGDPTPIGYTVEDAEGNETSATVTVGYGPVANDDEVRGNQPGTVVTVPVVGNDLGDVDPTTVRIADPTTGDSVTELVVPGEGTWAVDPETGDITFTPEPGFDGNPTPIGYTVEDADGNPAQATVVVTYLPVAANDEDLDNTVGTVVTVPVAGNDSSNAVPSTVRITDPVSGAPVTELVVPGEGTWTVDPETGDITFTPEAGFIGDPTPIGYTIADADGNTASATVTVTYLSDPVDDVDLGNTIGQPVTVPVAGNDPDGLDPATIKIIDPGTGELVTTVTVPGEGTWTVDPKTGAITFTPEAGFEGNPTPIEYVYAPAGQPATEPASVTVGYDPVAVNDSSTGNTAGSTVTVPVLDNDRGDLVPSTVRIIDPATGEAVTELVVPGEGVWTVDLETGAITFTPEDGFTGNPTPIEYSVQDVAGLTTTATVTIEYADAVAPGLATTGGEVQWTLAGLGALLLGAGASVVAFLRRRGRMKA